MNNNVLALRTISFKFNGDAPYFFKDLSLTFTAKKIHFICGRNGVGKSVFFKLVQGKILQHEVVQGSFELDGQNFHLDTTKKQLPDAYTNQIHTVCQKFDHMLADNFTFKQNLSCANFSQKPGLQLLPEHKPLPDFLLHLGIDMNKPVKFLSGGQRQILAITMILQKPTKVLLLDEPTAALDDANADLVMNFLHHLIKTTDLTVLIISHDTELVRRYAPDGFYRIMAEHANAARLFEFVPNQ